MAKGGFSELLEHANGDIESGIACSLLQSDKKAEEVTV